MNEEGLARNDTDTLYGDYGVLDWERVSLFSVPLLSLYGGLLYFGFNVALHA